jgi:hypothetical protein
MNISNDCRDLVISFYDSIISCYVSYSEYPYYLVYHYNLSTCESRKRKNKGKYLENQYLKILRFYNKK